LLSLPGVPEVFEPAERIVGGRNINITEVSWQVSMFWGSMFLDLYYLEELRGTVIRIRNQWWCKLKYPFMSSDDICAGWTANAVCHGDSGGRFRTGRMYCLASGLFASVAKYSVAKYSTDKQH